MRKHVIRNVACLKCGREYDAMHMRSVTCVCGAELSVPHLDGAYSSLLHKQLSSLAQAILDQLGLDAVAIIALHEKDEDGDTTTLVNALAAESPDEAHALMRQIGRASCRERG